MVLIYPINLHCLNLTFKWGVAGSKTAKLDNWYDISNKNGYYFTISSTGFQILVKVSLWVTGFK